MSEPEFFNAAQWLLGRHASATPDRAAVTAVDASGARLDLSYGQLEELAWQAAGALVAAGVRPEERLLLCMADSPELVALFLGGLYIGAVPVPVSTMVTAADLATLAADSRPALLAVSAEFIAAAQDAAGRPAVREVVVAGTTEDLEPLLAPQRGRAGPRIRTLRAFLAAAGPADQAAARAAPPTRPDSPAFWLYTSGTTGTPKAAMHRHDALRVTAQTYAAQVLGIGPDDVCYSAAKFFFAYGLGNTLTFPFSVGARAVLDQVRATPARLASVLTTLRPTLFFAAPTAYAAMLAADLPADTFASVRLGVSAGESFPADLYQRFTDRFGIEILDGIGSTEALHIFLSNRPGRVRPGTTGEVVPGYELRIEGPDGALVPDGEPGSLYVRGDSVATGYWCRSAVTRRVFRGEWLRTGDIYARDAEGYYTCLGRSDDVMKVAGMWVSPTEVETRLRAHPAVEQAVVVAVPDRDGLDKSVACVVTRAGTQPTAAELIEFCRAGLAAFKRPRQVLFLDQFPLTATGKVQRFRLREHAIEVLGTPQPAPAGQG
ncbi:MAG TPA: benzoate-CoA ligase family protein [Streptosporangiaceae bacterium]|nr:benzoate-CoA ligase family protein [Streptosporangiaceae bacterium]